MDTGAKLRAGPSIQKDGLQSGASDDQLWIESSGSGDAIPETQSVHLTRREREVLALMCEGLSNKLIGRRLRIAPSTVKVHVSKILRVLNVSNRLQAVLVSRCWDLLDESYNHVERLNGSARGRHR